METVVSVITPTFNLIQNKQVENFGLLISLLSMQTFKNIEHIVVDNSSTDGTKEILEEYQNKGLIKYISIQDKGKFDAYNKGIDYASGKYLTFLTCDDFLHDIIGLQDVVAALDAANADFSYSPSYCRHPEDFVFLFVPSFFNVFQVLPCPRQCMMFKKEILVQEHGFDTEFKYLADYDLMIRLAMKKYNGIFVNRNYLTYKLAFNLYKDKEAGEEELKRIFIKNYNTMYDMNDSSLLNNMVKYSDFPKELLNKLSVYFSQEDRNTFFEKCEQMHQLRVKYYK